MGQHTPVSEAAGETAPVPETAASAVPARPIEGAANEALLQFLAEALRVPRRRCVLVSGETGRQKRVRIEAPERAHAERVLADWLQTSS